MAGITTADVSFTGPTIAAASVTGTYAALNTFNGKSVQVLVLINTLNQEVTLSLDEGVTNWMVLPVVSTFLSITLPHMQWSGVVSIKHNGAAATAGRLSIGFIGAV